MNNATGAISRSYVYHYAQKAQRRKAYIPEYIPVIISMFTKVELLFPDTIAIQMTTSHIYRACFGHLSYKYRIEYKLVELYDGADYNQPFSRTGRVLS